MPKRAAAGGAGAKAKKRKTKHQGDPELADLRAPVQRKRAAPSVEEQQQAAAAAEQDMIALADLSDSDSEGEEEQQARRQQARRQEARAARGVVYVGRLPYGFFERELRGYFSQFGAISRLRLSRNKRTGRSKHYAFIEFEEEGVAEIVADAMDGYLLYRHILQVHVLPPDRVHPRLFRGANRTFVPARPRAATRALRNAPKTADQVARTSRRLLEKEEEKRKQLQELGIDYDFPGYAGKKAKAGKEKAEKTPEKAKKKATPEKAKKAGPSKSPRKTATKAR